MLTMRVTECRDCHAKIGFIKMAGKDRTMPVNADSVYYIQKAGGDYDEILKMDKEPIYDISAYSEEFGNRLNSVLEEIFDQSVPFSQTDNEDHCKNCDFRMLCNR